MVANVALLPENWRKQIPEKIGLLPFPDLSTVIDEAGAILSWRTEAGVAAIASDLWKRLAQAGDVVFLPTSLIPRLIYGLHTNSFSLTKAEKEHPKVSLNEHLAVAALVQLWQAHRVYTKAGNHESWAEAATAVANARTLADWIYILNVTGTGSTASVGTPAKQETLPLVKAKTTKKTKSGASKQKVIAYYEQHKHEPKFKSIGQAANAIDDANLGSYTLTTIVKSLNEHHAEEKKAKK